MKVDWLYECARHSRRIPERAYILALEKSSGVAKGQSALEKRQMGHANDEQGQLEKNRDSAFDSFTLPPARGGKEVSGDYEVRQGTRSKPETAWNNQKTTGK